MKPILHTLHHRHGLDVCGEGGEYETLVLDCPLFTKRLVIDSSYILVDQEDSDVGNLCITALHLADKDGEVEFPVLPELAVTRGTIEHCDLLKTLAPIPLPAALSIENVSASTAASTTVFEAQTTSTPAFITAPSSLMTTSSDAAIPGLSSSEQHVPLESQTSFSHSLDRLVTLPLSLASSAPTSIPTPPPPLPFPIGDDSEHKQRAGSDDPRNIELFQGQLDGLFRSLLTKLQHSTIQQGLSEHPPQVGLEAVAYVHLYLSDMGYFKHTHEVYSRWFGRLPPSRSTVAVPLPAGSLVAADVTILTGRNATQAAHFMSSNRPERRQVLHVQSLSEWAPISLGCYSQANVVEGVLVLLAGQIALDPATMKVSVDTSHRPEKVKPHWNDLPSFTSNAEGEGDRMQLQHQLFLCVRHVKRLLHSLESSLTHLTSCVLYLHHAIPSHLHDWLAVLLKSVIGWYIEDDWRRDRLVQTRSGPSGQPWMSGGNRYDCASGSDDDEDDDDMGSIENSDNKLDGSETLSDLSLRNAIPAKPAEVQVQVLVVDSLPREGALVELEAVAMTTAAWKAMPMERREARSDVSVSDLMRMRTRLDSTTAQPWVSDVTVQDPFWTSRPLSSDASASESVQTHANSVTASHAHGLFSGKSDGLVCHEVNENDSCDSINTSELSALQVYTQSIRCDRCLLQTFVGARINSTPDLLNSLPANDDKSDRQSHEPVLLSEADVHSLCAAVLEQVAEGVRLARVHPRYITSLRLSDDDTAHVVLVPVRGMGGDVLSVAATVMNIHQCSTELQIDERR